MRIRDGILLTLMLAAGCDQGGPGPGPGNHPDGGGDGSSPGPSGLTLIADTLDGAATGDGTALVVDTKGAAHVLYFTLGPEMTCTTNGTSIKYRAARLLHRSVAAGAVSAPTEVSEGMGAVATGVSAALDPKTDAPVVAYQGGARGIRYCAGSDLILARLAGGAVSRSTIAASSTAGVEPVETSGDVVGAWSALAIGKGGAHYLGWQDNHFAFANNDFAKADLEFASSTDGRSFRLGAYVAAGGAGRLTTMGLRTQGGVERPVLGFTFNEQGVGGGGGAGGVRVAVATVAQDGKATFAVGNPVPGLGGVVPSALAVAPGSGRIGLLYLDPALRLYRFIESDDGMTWSAPQTVDREGVAGAYVGLRYDGLDRPVAAYYACGEDPGRGCDPATDSVRVARRGPRPDDAWEIAVVDKGGDGTCGAHVSLGIALGQGNKVWIAYQCNLFDHGRSEFVAQVRYAHEK
jgi:hypothetical protein